MEIAVLVRPDGETASIQEPAAIWVFKHACDGWEVCRSMPFALQSIRDLQGS